jgi:NAD(P)-dependent dehydrogenase (short-subunit alcohol dehydrogenase family)
MDPAGRVALVTGSARRLGKAIALGLARAGSHIAVHHHASPEEASATVAELERLGVRTAAFTADLRDPRQISDLFESIERTFGRLDILVNSAATFEHAPVLQIRAEDWDRVMSLNLRAPFLCGQRAVELMRAGGSGLGKIINMVDVGAFEPWPGYVHHCVSKAGLVMLTRAMARALAPDILVNAVAPGTVLPQDGASQEELAELAGMTLLGRLGTPADAVRAVLFLVESDYVTGETVVVDGGKTLRR